MIKPFYYYVFRIKDGLFVGNKRAADVNYNIICRT